MDAQTLDLMANKVLEVPLIMLFIDQIFKAKVVDLITKIEVTIGDKTFKVKLPMVNLMVIVINLTSTKVIIVKPT